MYVACPSCRTLYELTADYLRAAGGQVRCSQCQTRFDARCAVFDDPGQAQAYEYPQQEALMAEIDDLVGRALGQDVASAEVPDSPVEAATAADSPAQMAASPCAAADCYAQPGPGEFVTGKPQPETVQDLPPLLLMPDDERPVSRTAWGAIAASLLLTLGFMVQYAYADRYHLAQIAGLRPALDMFCGVLHCDLPLRRDPAQVEMTLREVRNHPSVNDALLLRAAFVNRADFVQAYPVLQVSFSDVSGTPVAVRRFEPDEYLPDSSVSDRGMLPGEEALVMLEVVDPGTRAVSFQFDFM